MAPARITSVGFDFPSDQITQLGFYSNSSLLDFDVIVFSPIVDANYHAGSTYLGKPCFDDDQSFRLKDALRHWKRELSDALAHGKTVFVYLCNPETVYVSTGKKEFSGTGRNRQTTNLVQPISNYSSLPFEIKPTAATGSKMSVVAEFKDLLQDYWSFAGERCAFRAIPEGAPGSMCIKTTTGEKAVGQAFSKLETGGVVFLLPFIELDDEEFQDEDDYGSLTWTQEGKQFGARLLEQLVWIHNNARQQSSKTPAPQWSKEPVYLLTEEIGILSEIDALTQQIDRLVSTREECQADLSKQAQLRDLLFENGKGLEAALHLALSHLGFSTSHYKENDSEFDVVFEAPEGRLLGEAEGKDSKAINVTKLRQLQMNVLEDLEREEIETPAKAVLFGNGYRLTEPTDRPEQFTAKCVAAASQNGTALVSSVELFSASKYLVENTDDAFAVECRKAIIEGVGVVTLPEPPNSVG